MLVKSSVLSEQIHDAKTKIAGMNAGVLVVTCSLQ